MIARWLSRLILLLVLVIALCFGMLNGSMVELDVLMATWQLPLGVALMIFLAVGVLIGGLGVYLGQAFHKRPVQRTAQPASKLPVK